MVSYLYVSNLTVSGNDLAKIGNNFGSGNVTLSLGTAMLANIVTDSHLKNLI